MAKWTSAEPCDKRREGWASGCARWGGGCGGCKGGVAHEVGGEGGGRREVGEGRRADEMREGK